MSEDRIRGKKPRSGWSGAFRRYFDFDLSRYSSRRIRRARSSMSSNRQRMPSGSSWRAHSCSTASMRSGKGNPLMPSISRPVPSRLIHASHACQFFRDISTGMEHATQGGGSPFSSWSSRQSSQLGRASASRNHAAQAISFFCLPVRPCGPHAECGPPVRP